VKEEDDSSKMLAEFLAQARKEATAFDRQSEGSFLSRFIVAVIILLACVWFVMSAEGLFKDTHGQRCNSYLHTVS
jgi:hypothetical protein